MGHQKHQHHSLSFKLFFWDKCHKMTSPPIRSLCLYIPYIAVNWISVVLECWSDKQDCWRYISLDFCYFSYSCCLIKLQCLASCQYKVQLWFAVLITHTNINFTFLFTSVAAFWYSMVCSCFKTTIKKSCASFTTLFYLVESWLKWQL